MAFDFPAAPIVGQTYTAGGGAIVYMWDGNAWMKGSGSSAGTNPYVLLAGDTMLGFLTANADPTAPLHYATKQYVDQKLTGTLGAPGEAHVINTTGQPEWGAPIEAGNF
jgi:hypothetical protein